MLVKKHLEKLNEFKKIEDYNSVFITIESILFIDKENKEALFERARCLIGLKRYEAAFKQLSKLINDKVFGYKTALYMKFCIK